MVFQQKFKKYQNKLQQFNALLIILPVCVGHNDLIIDPMILY